MRLVMGVATIAAAILLDAATASAQGMSPAAASEGEKRRAQELYEQATTLLDAKRIDEARAAFRASHEVVASPASRFMIACTLRDQQQFARGLT